MAVYEERFDVGGIHVRADVKTIPLFRRNHLQNDFASVYWENATGRQGMSPNVSRARNLVIAAGVEHIEIAGRARRIDDAEPLRDMDEESSEDFMDNFPDELLKRIVKYNRFLYQKEPFWPFFQQFGPAGADVGNPTDRREKTTSENVWEAEASTNSATGPSTNGDSATSDAKSLEGEIIPAP